MACLELGLDLVCLKLGLERELIYVSQDVKHARELHIFSNKLNVEQTQCETIQDITNAERWYKGPGA